MIRALNVVCVALMGLAILGLYHVSEKTRVTRMELNATTRQIAAGKSAIAVLQAEWGHVASPDRVQSLAAAHGMNDAVSAQLSAFEQLPRRGDGEGDNPLGGSPVRNANAEVPAPQASSGF